MKFFNRPHTRTINAKFITPSGDPVRQAEHLVDSGSICNQRVWLNACVHGEQRVTILARCIHDRIQYHIHRKGTIGHTFRPHAIHVLYFDKVFMYADYERGDFSCRKLRAAYIRAESDMVRQVRQILTLGLACKSLVVLYGDHVCVHALARLMDNSVLKGSCYGVRIVEPRPLALCVATEYTLTPYADYSAFHSGQK